MLMKLQNIKKSYFLWEEEYIVLNGVNLEVQEWEFLSIMGPSGSGKSTLMNIIGMLDTPTSGEYFIEDQRVDNVSDAKQSRIRREIIGFIFQNYSLIPRLSVLEQVKLPLIYQGFSQKDAKQMSLEALEKVWLKWKEKSMPNELSGWQKQRVAIARAIVISPKIMLADEPTWALDTKTSNDIMQIFQSLNAEGKTIIIITHESDIAAQTKRIINIRDGNIV